MLQSLWGGPLISFGTSLLCWVLSLAICVANLFISLYLYITHDDMKTLMIEPGELADNINTVS